MTDIITLVFFILLVSGILLLCIEIFVPGGVLGGLGVAALFGSIIAAFLSPEMRPYAPLISILIILGLGVAMLLWVKLFPKSGLGKQMTLQGDGRDFKATEDGLNQLVGAEGEAKSDLRPGGIAIFGGKRVDVVSEGALIRGGKHIKVVSVEGNRVVVREI